MGYLDTATLNIAGINFVNTHFSAKTNRSYFKTRDFINPRTNKAMTYIVGVDADTDEIVFAGLAYDGAEVPLRYDDNVYNEEDVATFIAETYRDEIRPDSESPRSADGQQEKDSVLISKIIDLLG